MKILLRVASVLSFVFCLVAGGLLIFPSLRLLLRGNTDNAFPLAVGLYFIAKGFFVGPILFVTAEKCGRKDVGK